MTLHSNVLIVVTLLSSLFLETSSQRVEMLVWMRNEGTRILGNFYPRRYKAIYLRDGCPPAVSDFHCADFILFFAGCPVYECGGVFMREPCNFDDECGLHGVCENFICVYPGGYFAGPTLEEVIGMEGEEYELNGELV
uniref:Uncharacterized protein n=1 Tax=Trichuris muris TaxID=70415 RepID=A0A5S6QNB1_TRIMR